MGLHRLPYNLDPANAEEMLETKTLGAAAGGGSAKP
jgi:hypothetical protein